ncbi:MAG: hypothetical protein IT307_05315 [Chloroflexi bacterium]|nr:hypothetical protein [Chloroflexota bacterium]
MSQPPPDLTALMFSQLFGIRGKPPVDPRQLAEYGALAQHVFSRTAALHEAWFVKASLEGQEEDLANVAAIHRWEAAGLAVILKQVEPPPGFTRAHQQLVDVVERVARASRLLSTGYRFHSSSARCDGQALMVETAQRLRLVQRRLEERGISVAPGEQNVAPSE